MPAWQRPQTDATSLEDDDDDAVGGGSEDDDDEEEEEDGDDDDNDVDDDDDDDDQANDDVCMGVMEWCDGSGKIFPIAGKISSKPWIDQAISLILLKIMRVMMTMMKLMMSRKKGREVAMS